MIPWLHSSPNNKGLEALSVSLHQQCFTIHLLPPLCLNSWLLPSAYHHRYDRVCKSDLALWQLMRETPICPLCSKTTYQGLNHLRRSGTKKPYREVGETHKEEEKSGMWVEFGKWQLEIKDPVTRWRDKGKRRPKTWLRVKQRKKLKLRNKNMCKYKRQTVYVSAKGVGKGKE